MDPRTIARGQALGRVAFGFGLVVAPSAVAGAWVGGPAERPGGRVLAVAMGARDLAIGLALLRALGRSNGAGAWIRAGMLADTADLVATLRERDELPTVAVPVVAAMAAGSVVVGLYLQTQLD
jgi:hypothetical protein